MDAGTKPTPSPANVVPENSIVPPPLLSGATVRVTDIPSPLLKNILLLVNIFPSSSNCIPGDASASTL